MKIAPETPKINLGSSGHAVLRAYLSLLVIGGHVGLPLALGTMFASHTASQRYPTLINMLLSWITYATATLLLLYAGEYQSRQPNFGLCLAQASLVYASTVMVGTATLCLVLQLWLELQGRSVTYLPRKSKILLVGMPWFILVLMTIVVAIYGSINPSKVSYRWLFYCTISSNAIINTVSGLTLTSLAVTCFFEGLVIRTLYKASRQIRSMNRASYYMSLRVSLFAAYTIVTFIIAGINILIPDLIFPYIFICTLPLTACVIFGTTQDNVEVWKRCLRRRRRDSAIRLEPIAFASNRVGESSGATSTVLDSDISKPKHKPAPTVSDSVEQLAAPTSDTISL